MRAITIYISVFITLSVIFPLSAKTAIAKPYAQKGILDLSNWDLKQHGPINLSGQWEFYWKNFVTSNNFRDKTQPKTSGFIKLPGTWNNYRINNKKISGKGYATYRLKVITKTKKKKFGIILDDMSSAYKLFVNGKLVISSGNPGTTSKESFERYTKPCVFFKSETEITEFILHISNFSHRKGGPWNPIVFGLEKDITQKHEWKKKIISFYIWRHLHIGIISYFTVFLKK